MTKNERSGYGQYDGGHWVSYAVALISTIGVLFNARGIVEDAKLTVLWAGV